MKKQSRFTLVFYLCIAIAGIISSIAAVSETHQSGRFLIPNPIPQTHYYIEATIDQANNRMDGHETIKIINQSKNPITQLIVDWPDEMDIVYNGEPVRSFLKGVNGLSGSQVLFNLPQAIQQGKSAALEIQFHSPLRLRSVTKLEGWFPQLWWGRNTTADYEVKLNAPEEYRVAASGVFDESRNSYIAENCRKFGLVLMKGLDVLQAKSGGTTIYSYYDEGSRECVEFTHQIAIDAIDFYRNWLGFYPRKVLHIVPGGLSHPAGGYPIATSIVGIHGQKQFDKAPQSHWQFITAHEIGHEYWIEHVLEAPNQFWLMIGLGVYADRAFMLAKGYGDQRERDMMSRYIKGVREQLDTRMNRLPEEMQDVQFDYNNVINHGKGFSVISALACAIGKDAFESAYKRCLKEYKGKTLCVSDFQRVCEEESGEILDWFFDSWIRTSDFLSYEIVSQETSFKDGKYETIVNVKNRGTLSMPVPVTAFFEDGSSQCLFTSRLLDECALIFTSETPLKDLKIDAQNELPMVTPPPEPTLKQLKEKLRELDFDGEGDEALQIYNRVQSIIQDGQVFSWCRLGMYLYDEKHDEEALQAFQKDSLQNPTSFLSYVWQGHIYDLLNQRDKAVTCYKKALALNPTSWVRHDQWGMKIDRAWIERRIESPFQRPDPKILSLKNRIQDLEWTGDGDKALQIFNEVKSLNLEDEWGKLGLCLYDGKHYEEALQAFQKDSQLNPNSFGSLVWQGHLNDLLNQREKALSCYQKALEMNPTSWIRHDQYGIKIDLEWIKERLETPYQRHESDASNMQSEKETQSEPGLADILKQMGYDASVIETPLSVAQFKASANPSAQILQKNGNARINFGWYSKEEKHPLFENLSGPTQSKPFQPGDAAFGFYIDVDFQDEYHWYTEISRNKGEAHVKVYPLVKDGQEIPASYLLCWEDLPLGMDIIDDYQDIIVHVSGVAPVEKEK